jgi:hypothetical protein
LTRRAFSNCDAINAIAQAIISMTNVGGRGQNEAFSAGSPLAPSSEDGHLPRQMQQVKDTLRATVRIGYDGRVHKTFRGPKAEDRFATEVRVLRHLEERGCPFVPRLLEAHPEQLKIVTTNCGTRVDHLDDTRMKELYDELLAYGVRHDDAEMRNVTYRNTDGRFCLIDFEFATILPDSATPPDGPAA